MREPVELAEYMLDQVWNRQDMSLLDRTLAEDYTDHALPAGEGTDAERYREYLLELRGALPDLKLEIEDSYEDENYAIIRSVIRGTHREPWRGIAPTNEPASFETIEIFRVENEEIIERWAVSDLLGFMQELESAPDSILTPEQAELIAHLERIPDELRNALRDHNATQRAGEEWSPAATIGHLWRVEREVWQARLQEMSAEDNPFWEWWDPARYDWEAEFGATNVNVLLDGFTFLRTQTCNYLRDLPQEDWARIGTHATFGELDVAGLMQECLTHDREHIANLQGAAT